MPDEVKQALEDVVGLSKDENRVYALILRDGFGSTYSLTRFTNLKDSKIQDILNFLEKKQYIKKAPGKVVRYVPLRPFSGFINKLDAFGNEIKTAQTDIKKIQSDNEKQFAALSDQVKSKTTEFTTQMKTTITTGRTTLKNTVTDTQAKIGTQSDGFKKSIGESFSKPLGVVWDKFNKGAQDQSSELDSKIKELAMGIDADFKGFLSQLQTQFAQIMQANKIKFDTVAKKIADNVTQDETNLKTVETTLFAQLKADLDKFKDNITNLKNIVKKEVDVSLVDTKKAFTSIDTDLKTKWDTFLTQINTQIANIKQRTTDIIGNFQESVEGKLEEVDEVQKENLNQFKDLTIKELNNFSESITTLARDSVDALQAKINALMIVSDNFSKTLESQLTENTGSIIQDGIAATKKFTTDLNTDVKTYLDKTFEMLKTGTTKQKDIPTLLTSLQEDIKKREKEFATKIQENSASLIGKLQQLPQTFSDNITKTSADWNSRITEELNATRGSIAQSFESSVEEFNTSTKNSLDKIMELVSQTIEDASERLSGLMQSVSQVNSETTTEVNDQLSQSGNSLSQTINAKNAEFSKQLNQQYGILEQKIKDIPEKNLSVPVQKMDELSTKIRASQDPEIKQMEQFKTDSTAWIAEIQKKLEDTGTFIMNNLNTKIAAIPPKLQNDLKEAAGSFSTIKDSLNKAYQQAVQDVSAQAVQSGQGTVDKIKGTFDTFQTTLIQILKSLEDAVGKQSDGLRSTLQSNLDDSKKAFNTRLQSFLDKVLTPMDKIYGNNMGPLNSIQNGFESIMGQNVFNVDKSWMVVGKDQVMAYIYDLMNRSKQMELVVPKFEDVDWKLVQDRQKKGLKVQVITDYSSSQAAKQVPKLTATGITFIQYGDKDLIAAIRDKDEEALLCPVSGNEEIAAIVTESSPFVKKLATMIGDYWKRNAKPQKNTNPA